MVFPIHKLLGFQNRSGTLVHSTTAKVLAYPRMGFQALAVCLVFAVHASLLADQHIQLGGNGHQNWRVKRLGFAWPGCLEKSSNYYSIFPQIGGERMVMNPMVLYNPQRVAQETNTSKDAMYIRTDHISSYSPLIYQAEGSFKHQTRQQNRDQSLK